MESSSPSTSSMHESPNVPRKREGRVKKGRGGRRGGLGKRKPRGLMLTETDVERLARLKADKKKRANDMVDELDGVSAKQLLKQVIERNPSLILDVAAKLSPEEPIPCPHPEVPSWCVCQHCRDMPTDLEKLCCGMRPDLCSSTQPVSF